MLMKSFKENFTFEQRKELFEKITEKHTGKLPIIVEGYNGSKTPINLKRKKYLTGPDVTVGAFIAAIRQHITVSAEQAIFLFCKNSKKMPATGTLMSTLYENNKDDDGFLYLIVMSENTFG